MSVADILLSIVIWLFQRTILPILPTNLPALSFASFEAILGGTLKHNIIYSFSGLAQIFNLKLLFILITSMIFAEIVFWLVKAGFFIIKMVRG